MNSQSTDGIPTSKKNAFLLGGSSSVLKDAGLDVDSLLRDAHGYAGLERREANRVPRTLEIFVQPLDNQMAPKGDAFFAVTRDISNGGLAYLSSHEVDFEKAVITIKDGAGSGILCRICNHSTVHQCENAQVGLTNVQFLSVWRGDT